MEEKENSTIKELEEQLKLQGEQYYDQLDALEVTSELNKHKLAIEFAEWCSASTNKSNYSKLLEIFLNKDK